MIRLLPLLLAACFLGCAQTPRERWLQQREAITLAQDGTRELHATNLISDESARAVTPWLLLARDYNWRAYFQLRTDEVGAMQTMDGADRQLDKTAIINAGGGK